MASSEDVETEQFSEKLKEIVERDILEFKEPYASYLVSQLESTSLKDEGEVLKALSTMNTEPSTNVLEEQLFQLVQSPLEFAYKRLFVL